VTGFRAAEDSPRNSPTPRRSRDIRPPRGSLGRDVSAGRQHWTVRDGTSHHVRNRVEGLVASWAVGVQIPLPTPIYVRKRKRPREPSRAPGAIVCPFSVHSLVLLSPDPIGPPHSDADYRVVAVRQRYCNPASTSAERVTPSSAAWTMRKMKTAAAAANAIRNRG
jgi:hypothetical protein